MKIIIGLGNPGNEFKGTRHNVGFETINKLSYDFNITMKLNRKFKANTGEGRIGATSVILMQPLTYMNLSGESAISILNFYKLTPQDIIVIYDDVNLPVGDIRVREKGSAGGQKGMISIISHLNTDEFDRIRIGVGSKPPSWSLSDYVLSKFLREEWEDMIKGITKAGDATELILKSGTKDVMNLYNKKIPKEKP